YTSSASSADSKTADGGWPGPVRSSAPSSFEKWPGGQPRKGHGSPRRATPAREGPRQPEKGYASPKRARVAPNGPAQPRMGEPCPTNFPQFIAPGTKIALAVPSYRERWPENADGDLIALTGASQRQSSPRAGFPAAVCLTVPRIGRN